MKFVGIKRVFSTKNEGQYATIGAFWNEMSAKYGVDNPGKTSEGRNRLYAKC